MRILLVPAVVVTALVLTACGGAKDAASSAIDRAQSAASQAGDAASSAAAAASSAAAGTGDVDCSALTQDDVAKFVVYTQLLAQAGSADSIDLLRTGAATDFTAEGMATVLDHLRVLEGHPGPGQPDPKAAIDYFARANELVGQMVAASGAPTQAQLDAYEAAIVDVPTALKNQLAINLSLGTSCTNLG
jgi:hypothetical protein